MRIRTSILLALTATVLAASAADVETLVDEGVALHDQGRLDEAEAKFRAALSLNGDHLRARYELAYTLSELGRYRECADEALTVTRRESPIQAAAHGVAGNCWDQLGEPKKALKAYEKGLKLEPGEPMLNFNYAVTLAGRDRASDAIEAAKIAAGGRPDWPSAQLLLAQLYHGAGLRVPAMRCALRFLILERLGYRAGVGLQPCRGTVDLQEGQRPISSVLQLAVTMAIIISASLKSPDLWLIERTGN